MSIEARTNDKTDLSAFPGVREARSPFDPPPGCQDWSGKDKVEIALRALSHRLPAILHP
jgi:hypothetical protein